MNRFDNSNQVDSPSLFAGEIRTGMGRARQSSAGQQSYPTQRFSPRVRGTPEYNPLYDTFESTLAASNSNKIDNQFRPITPKSHTVQQYQDDMTSTYDKPRTYYRDDDEQRQIKNKQRQHVTHSQKKSDSSPNSEAGLLMERVDSDSNEANNLHNGKQEKSRHRRRILYNILDFLAIFMTCLIFGLIYLLIKPVQRGFFCDDTSIQYPFRPDTIPMWLLGIYGGVGPIVIFCIIELWVVRPFSCRRGSTGAKQRQIDYVKTIFHTIFLFVLGIAVCFLITEVGKRTIGRLRPYYLTVCNPIWEKIQCTKTVNTASGTFVIPQYVRNHNCNTSVSELELQEAKLSFPSGHSSYSTYAFIFLFVYFEARLVCPKIRFVKPFLQCLCVAIAFFTCLSRVTDHKHHATDVIGGALIGFCIAVFTAVRVGTYLWTFSVYCETEEETKKDRLPKDERITILGVESPSSDPTNSNQQQSGTERERFSNRSNYDNVAAMSASQQQGRGVSNVSKSTVGQRKTTTGRGYEEANV